ncbi:unnamed protein product [Rotaria magnacalcarata]
MSTSNAQGNNSSRKSNSINHTTTDQYMTPMELSEDHITASKSLKNGSKIKLPRFTIQGGRFELAPTSKYQNKNQKKEVRSMLLEMYKKNQEKYQEVSVAEPKRSIIFNVDHDIFRWSAVRTDFELFADFLPLLKKLNDFPDTPPNRAEEQSSQDSPSGIKCLKTTLWSQFSGFMHRSEQNLDETSKETVLEYYRSKLTKDERETYSSESFIGKFKLLSKITKACPVRLDWLNDLQTVLERHSQTYKTSATEPGKQGKTYRLFATIIIDRLSIAYCSFRVQAVHEYFQTSRLTRHYKEESFLRVSYVQTPLNMDMAFRLASLDECTQNDARDFVSNVNSIVHNISTFISMIGDLDRNFQVSECNPELKEEDIIRRMNESRLKPVFFAKWSSSGFDSVEEQIFLLNRHFPFIDSEGHSNTGENNVQSFKIAGQDFRYLMTTSSGVHRNSHVFCTKQYSEVRDYIFSKKSRREYKDNLLKLSLRMGLWLTPSVSMPLPHVEPKAEPDVGKHTDGCGRLSVYWAKKMSEKWNEAKKFKNIPFTSQNVGPTQWNEKIENDAEIEYDNRCIQPAYYSAFQVRINGMKGMFVVDTRLGDLHIYAYDSQKKFTPSEKSLKNTVEIVQCAQPMTSARLNFSLISLIVGCANSDESAETIEKYIIKLAQDEIKELLEQRSTAIRFAIEHNDVKSFNMLGAGCTKLDTFLAGYYQNYARRFKFLIPNSRRLFGVADFWDILKEGEVFIAVSNIEQAIEGDVLVTKEPCIHRGDLRKLTAVSKDEVEKRFKDELEKRFKDKDKEDNLNNLNDVIVFSCKGK